MFQTALTHDIRRAPGSTGGQTDGNPGRKKLAGSASRNYLVRVSSRPHPPSRIEQVLKKFGKKIQALRKRRGFSEQRFGNDCALTASKIKQIEAGQFDPNFVIMTRFADLLSVSLCTLLRGIK